MRSWDFCLFVCFVICLFVVVLVVFAVDSVVSRIVIQLFAICDSVTCVFWTGVEDFSMCDSSWRDPARLTGHYDWHASLSTYHPLDHSGANKDLYLVLNNAQPTEKVTLAWNASDHITSKHLIHCSYLGVIDFEEDWEKMKMSDPWIQKVGGERLY